MLPLNKPLLIFDGDCGFCRRIVDQWKAKTGESIDYFPFQEVSSRFPEIPRSQFERAVQLIEPSGHRSQGAEAVFRVLNASGQLKALLFLYLRLPGFKWIAELGYKIVAQNRFFFSKFF